MKDFVPVDSASFRVSAKLDMGMKTVGTVTSDKYGRFKFDLEKESNFNVSGKKDGFLKKNVDATTEGKKDLKIRW